VKPEESPEEIDWLDKTEGYFQSFFQYFFIDEINKD